ncbi:hypothetical protein [Clostridium felsineum]|uniref:hypothetical protein n=1 Tax=Clostridium felsineum TaxID=36839 RepID=UPI00098C4BB4|nr:hypothetical protein [Clostridium felsineum]URZ02375.1 hypothetical protein CLAUR_023720 [Clostridium felsineum]
MSKNKIISIIVFIVLLISLSIGGYYKKYSICDSNQSIKNYLIKHNHINSKDIQIQKQINVKNAKIVVFKFSNNLFQYAFFKKGLNGRYSFTNIYSKEPLGYESFIKKIDGNFYLISLGYNPKNYKYIETNLSQISNPKNKINTAFNIKNQEYFIKYKVISDKFKDKYNISNYNLKNH